MKDRVKIPKKKGPDPNRMTDGYFSKAISEVTGVHKSVCMQVLKALWPEVVWGLIQGRSFFVSEGFEVKAKDFDGFQTKSFLNNENGTITNVDPYKKLVFKEHIRMTIRLNPTNNYKRTAKKRAISRFAIQVEFNKAARQAKSRRTRILNANKS